VVRDGKIFKRNSSRSPYVVTLITFRRIETTKLNIVKYYQQL
jgi:hypothetical protein